MNTYPIDRWPYYMEICINHNLEEFPGGKELESLQTIYLKEGRKQIKLAKIGSVSKEHLGLHYTLGFTTLGQKHITFNYLLGFSPNPIYLPTDKVYKIFCGPFKKPYVKPKCCVSSVDPTIRFGAIPPSLYIVKRAIQQYRLLNPVKK